jgi:hypothetical protein
MNRCPSHGFRLPFALPARLGSSGPSKKPPSSNAALATALICLLRASAGAPFKLIDDKLESIILKQDTAKVSGDDHQDVFQIKDL